MISKETKINKDQIDEMFQAGAHFGYDRSRRHPSTKSFIFGRKNNVEIFDLEKVQVKLDEALEFVKKVASENKQILFVAGKREAVKIVKDAALKIDMPYVAGRWIGGTLTNFEEIRKRVKHFIDLTSQKEKGELAKYKKRERVMIDKELVKLEERFGGLTDMSTKPAAIFIIDSQKEAIACSEANQENVPVISLSSSDNDLSNIDYPIPANDSSVSSIKYFVDKITKAYEEGQKERKTSSKIN